MGTLGQDLRYASRILSKNPLFTVVAILSLALGIGANTAIFSVLNGVVLRPLPFESPERLVVVKERDSSGEYHSSFSPADYLDLREMSRSFAEIAGHRGLNVTLTGAGPPQRVRMESVTPGFFRFFGVEPFMGRSFLPEGDPAVEGARSVVLAYGTWQGRFGGDPSIVGRVLVLNGEAHTVVGVAPSSFRYPGSAEAWVRSYRDGVPEPPVDVGDDLASVRDLGYFTVLGRLAPGVTLAEAEAETDLIAVRLAEANDGDGQNVDARLVPLHEELVGDVRPVLLLLLGAVGLVLLIACANIANLLLARSTARAREVAVRAALGAGRGRLVRQFMTESVLLALAAGGIGLLVSIWGVEALVRLVPAGVPRLSEIGVDGAVLLFTLAVSLLTGAAFGLVPALQASRPDLQASLKEGSRGAGEGRRSRRFSGAIVVAEVALSLVLLCAAGLFLKSLVRLLSVDPGFRPENLLVMRIDLPESRYPDLDQRRAFFREITGRVSTLPGVASAATALAHPFSGMAATLHFYVEGRPDAGGEDLATEYQPVSPGYFRTMGIPLVGGRAFTERDDAEAPRVVVINEAMARWQWPGEDPIGRRIAVGDPSGMMEIVGIVGDVRHFGLESAPRPEVYISCLQDPWPFMALVVRAQVDPLSLTGAVRDQVLAVDPEQAVYAVSTFERVIEQSTRQRRFTTLLLGIFTGVALLLALVGIYGVMSNAVSQRAREIGIRMALGARRSEVLRLVMGWGLRMVLRGTVVGLAGALALGQLLSSLLFGISPADPIVLASVVLVLIAASALAAYLPAHRASRVDPVVALRNE